MRLEPGDRVHYVVYPSGTSETSTTGTVVRVDGPDYYVEWDGIDYGRYEIPAYLENDLAPALP
jgi:hypothetical protein